MNKGLSTPLNTAIHRSNHGTRCLYLLESLVTSLAGRQATPIQTLLGHRLRLNWELTLGLSQLLNPTWVRCQAGRPHDFLQSTRRVSGRHMQRAWALSNSTLDLVLSSWSWTFDSTSDNSKTIFWIAWFSSSQNIDELSMGPLYVDHRTCFQLPICFYMASIVSSPPWGWLDPAHERCEGTVGERTRYLFHLSFYEGEPH